MAGGPHPAGLGAPTCPCARPGSESSALVTGKAAPCVGAGPQEGGIQGRASHTRWEAEAACQDPATWRPLRPAGQAARRPGPPAGGGAGRGGARPAAPRVNPRVRSPTARQQAGAPCRRLPQTSSVPSRPRTQPGMEAPGWQALRPPALGPWPPPRPGGASPQTSQKSRPARTDRHPGPPAPALLAADSPRAASTLHLHPRVPAKPHEAASC